MSYNPEYYKTHKEIYRAANLRWREKKKQQPGFKEKNAEHQHRYYMNNRTAIKERRNRKAEERKLKYAEQGKLVQDCRKASGVSVSELANLLGVSKQYLSSMERGETKVRVRWALDAVLAVASKRLETAKSYAELVSEVDA